MHRRPTAVASVLFLSVLAMVTGSSPANATHGNGCDACLPDPDNTTQCVKSPSITANSITARNQGFAQLDRTVIDTQYCTGDDIEVRDAYYGPNEKWGWTECSDLNSANRCDIYIVRFNETYSSTLSASQLRFLGCHEFGHTGSVGHRNDDTDSDSNSCMNGSHVAANTYDDHDIRAINGGF